MCFSATASYTSGVAIGALGLATLPMVRNRRELPFAALPLVFGVHQILEGVIWTQLDDTGGSIRTPAVVLWLFIAWTLLPIGIPLAVSLFEPDRVRRRVMYCLAALGAAIGLVLFVALMSSGTTADVQGHHVRYHLALEPGWVVALSYVAATCLPLLLSSRRFVVWFGIALTTSMAVTVAVNTLAFSSVWCFFAAFLSVGLFMHYFRARGSEELVQVRSA